MRQAICPECHQPVAITKKGERFVISDHYASYEASQKKQVGYLPNYCPGSKMFSTDGGERWKKS